MHKIPDIINGSFELFAGLFVLNHCRVLVKHKSVRGVSITSTIFFFAWGIWNLFYYPFLNQWASFLGGISVTSTNMLYVYLLIKYYNLEKKGHDGDTVSLQLK